MRNLFAAIELRANDYSSDIRKSLRGQVIGQIGCFMRGGTCVALLCASTAGVSEGHTAPRQGRRLGGISVPCLPQLKRSVTSGRTRPLRVMSKRSSSENGARHFSDSNPRYRRDPSFRLRDLSPGGRQLVRPGVTRKREFLNHAKRASRLARSPSGSDSTCVG